jgi:hypothetical protein
MSERSKLWPTPAARMPGHDATKIANLLTGNRHSFYLTHAIMADAIQPGIITNPTPTTRSSQLPLFAEGFPVSRTRLLVDAADLPTSAISGPSSSDSFAVFNPDGSWRKTCQGYSQVTLDGSLERFSETWPRAGMTRNGTAYRQVPLAPITDGTASGSWPTPGANDAIKSHMAPETLIADYEKQRHRARGPLFNLSTEVARSMWPTPCAEDAKSVPYQKGKGSKRYPMLLGAVRPEMMWPTPRAEHDSGSHHGSLDTLHSAIKSEHPNSGALNPTWVEWLMGYPLGWTACADWGTASFRRSPNGSRAGSARPKG